MRKLIAGLDNGSALAGVGLVIFAAFVLNAFFGAVYLGAFSQVVSRVLVTIMAVHLVLAIRFEIRRGRARRRLLNAQDELIQQQEWLDNLYLTYLGLYSRTREYVLLTPDDRKKLEGDFSDAERDKDGVKANFNQGAGRTFLPSYAGCSLKWLQDATATCQDTTAKYRRVNTRLAELVHGLSSGKGPFIVGSGGE